MREVGAPRGRQPLGPGAGGDDRVHRVRRLEAQRATGRARRTPAAPAAGSRWTRWPPTRSRVVSGTPVAGRGSRRGPRAARPRPGPGSGCSSPATSGAAAVEVGDQRRRRRVGVLVGVQPHRRRQLRGPVRGLPAQVGAQRQLLERDLGADDPLAARRRRHVTPRRRPDRSASGTAPSRPAPCAGRSSASASATTWPATSRSASSVVLDHVHAAQERLHRQPGGVPGAAAGGQHVVRPGAVVAERHRRERPDEDRPGVADPRGHRARRRGSGSPGARRRRRRRPRARRRRRRPARRRTAGRSAPCAIRSGCLVAATCCASSASTASASVDARW